MRGDTGGWEMDEYLTAAEAARYLRLAAGTLANRRVEGDGPPFMRLGTKIVYSSRDLDSWASARRCLRTAKREAGGAQP